MVSTVRRPDRSGGVQVIRKLQGLRAFVAVARRGSVRSAAREQHYDPSTVRSQVRSLEQQLRLRLLRRHGEEGTGPLSRAGEQLEPEAEHAVDAVDEVEAKASRIADQGP
ncbi:LysR family transcriptional regulator [Flexivirga sp.]|uniref:LysR family transcriptional regulator n=1 Tax=Flexivirga sp. TaxID=1962927 RepID=UPI003F80D16E